MDKNQHDKLRQLNLNLKELIDNDASDFAIYEALKKRNIFFEKIDFRA
jgi:hypothetical protein